MAAYTEGLLLVIAALVIAYEASQRLLQHPLRVDPAPLAMGFLVFSIVLEVGRTTILRARSSSLPSRSGWIGR